MKINSNKLTPWCNTWVPNTKDWFRPDQRPQEGVIVLVQTTEGDEVQAIHNGSHWFNAREKEMMLNVRRWRFLSFTECEQKIARLPTSPRKYQ
jgi:hypothetical protein